MLSHTMLIKTGRMFKTGRMSTLLLLTSALALVAAPAFAQMGGGGMGGGMGGGGGGGMGGGGRGGGHKRSQSQSQTPTAPVQNAMHAPATVPVSMRLTGKVIISGGTKALAHMAVAATVPDLSALYAERNAQVSLDTVDLSGAGDVSLLSDGRNSGLDSALLVGSQAAVTVTGGHISTTGKGANAAFVSDAGSKLSLKDVALATHASDAFGVEATAGGSVAGDGLTITTTADRSTALAVQSPDSRATLTGGHFSTQGSAANAFFVAGALDASGVTADTAMGDGLTADAARNVTLTDTSLTAGGNGAMLYAGDAPERGGGAAGSGAGGGHGGHHGGDHDGQGGTSGGAGMSGPAAPVVHTTDALPLADDAPLRRTAFAMTGGTLKAHRAAFYVTNLHAEITLDHVALQSESGILVRSVADQWGPLGRNGGDVHLVTHHQTLTGDFATDVVSSIALSLNDQSVLTGATTPNVDVDMDVSSQWVLTGDTNVGKLVDAAIAGDSVPNITGNGHTLTYDHRHNPQLANKTYALAGGGQLVPGGL